MGQLQIDEKRRITVEIPDDAGGPSRGFRVCFEGHGPSIEVKDPRDGYWRPIVAADWHDGKLSVFLYSTGKDEYEYAARYENDDLVKLERQD